MTARRLSGFVLLAILLFMLNNKDGGILPIPGNDLVPGAGKRVLVVYESSELSKYPQSQISILQGERVAKYLDGVVDKDEDGNPLYRIWDKDVDLTYVDDFWKAAMELSKDKELPHQVILNGKKSIQGPLPDTVDQGLELFKKHLE